jgi:hypothetical protein
MRSSRQLKALATAIACLALSACASNPITPVAEWDGLVRQPSSRLDSVFVRPGAGDDIGVFRSVLIDPVEVSFGSDFDPNHGIRGAARRLNADDLIAIKDGVARIFREVLTDELEAGGYAIVDVPGAETLRVSAAIIDLHVVAPDRPTAGRTRTFTTDSGRMTLVMELRDAVTGEVLARVIDRRTGRVGDSWTITNRVTNTADARRAVRVWAQALREGLDDLYARQLAREGAPGQ